MNEEEISHKEIFERVLLMEKKVDSLADSTEGVVKAFEAAQGAFTVLETMSKIAKPLLWLAGTIAAVVVFVKDFRSH